jgi:oxygen-dependent protoporphyrinogen oxidase
MPSVVVVGAGISGLTAAYDLARAGLEVTVVEADTRAGGKILTTPFAGRPVDCAADAFLARVPDAVELCRELALDEQLVSPATGQAFVYSDGKLHPFPERTVLGVPTDLGALAASGLVSEAGIRRAAEDLTMPGEPLRADESVGSLVRRRLGDEVFERLVAPLLSGVNAGDADTLSVEAGAAQLAEAVRDQPSLIAGLRAQLERNRSDPTAPVFYGLRTGIQTLTDALVAELRRRGARLVLGAPVVAVKRRPTRAVSGFELTMADGSSLDTDAAVLATPDFVTAELLAPLVPGVAGQLREVEYASVVMVTLAISKADIGRPLDGSGFLVARPEGLLLTACSWASRKWAHLDDPEVAVLRASAGRFDDRRALELDDDELVRGLLDDLATTMAPERDLKPLAVRVSRWPDSLPQFRPGHLDRVATWRAQLDAQCPGLTALGAGWEGLGLPACIRQARGAARRILRFVDPSA